MMAYVDAGYGVALIPAPDATMRGTNTLIRAVAGRPRRDESLCRSACGQQCAGRAACL